MLPVFLVVSQLQVRHMVAMAIERQPSIIFMDEIDARLHANTTCRCT